MKQKKDRLDSHQVQPESTANKIKDKQLADKDNILKTKDCSRFVEAFSDCV